MKRVLALLLSLLGLKRRKVKPRGYWNPERLDVAFDGLIKKAGRTPTDREVQQGHPAILHFIRKGRYHPEIKTFRSYLKHRGLSVHIRPQGGLPQT